MSGFKFSLLEKFQGKSGWKNLWHNDNERFRLVFSPTEVSALNALCAAFVQNGCLLKPVYKKGDDVSCAIFEKSEARKPVILAVVKQVMPESFPNYMVNFGIGFEPTATLNFPDVLRLGRMHLDRSFAKGGQDLILS